MTNKFTTADQQGRDMFKHYCGKSEWCKVIKESKDDFAAWDVSYMSGTTMIIGEIKVRGYESTTFSNWDYEVKKHQALKGILEQMKLKYPKKRIEIQYINFFEDDAVRIWTTTQIDEVQAPITVYRPSTTMGQQTQVSKQVYHCNMKVEADRGTVIEDIFADMKDNREDPEHLPF
jgi:hypothetical protein